MIKGAALRAKEVILFVPCLLLMGSNSAVAEDSFCKDWASWSPTTRADMLNKSTEILVDRGLRDIPGLLECVKRNMLVQRPAITKLCAQAPSNPDFTVGMFMGQLGMWLGISCQNDSAFTSTPRVQ